MTTEQTPDYVNAFFRANPGPFRPVMRLASGHYLSVQASSAHYCCPRQNNVDEYTAVEVWSWTTDRVPPAFKAHGGSRSRPASFVPVDVVNDYIHRHRGLRA
jgi:hypothetical protein